MIISKFLKPAQNIKSTYITCTIVPVPNQTVVDQKHERKRSHGAVLYRNLDTGNFSVTLSIFAFLESLKLIFKKNTAGKVKVMILFSDPFVYE